MDWESTLWSVFVFSWPLRRREKHEAAWLLPIMIISRNALQNWIRLEAMDNAGIPITRRAVEAADHSL